MAPKKTRKDVLKQKRIFHAYSPTKVKSALEAVRNGSMSVSQASTSFKVPRTSLRRKVSGAVSDLIGKTGPTPELGYEAEQKLKDWLLENARFGFPINKITLFDSVEQIVKESGLKTRFSGGRPGRKWFNGFLKRHQEISYRHSEYISKVRSDVTEEKIRNWFQEVSDLIDDTSVFEDPSRIFNADETAFSLTPNGGLVLMPRGSSVYYDVSENSDKSNITTLITVNAAGLMAPPLTVYKYQRLPQKIAKQAPEGWGIGTTETGWMTGEAFYEYITNVFHEWLNENKIQRPVLLFLDGHRSHMTLHLSYFCREKDIIVVALCPNATHILQPLDVAVFRSLKLHWKTLLRKWRYENDGAEVNKNNVALALDKLLRNQSVKESIISGFRKCRLYPFDVNAVDFNKCKPKADVVQHAKDKELSSMSHLEYLESKIQPEILTEFQQANTKCMDFEGDITACMLFDVWKAFKNDSEEEISVCSTNVNQSVDTMLSAPSTSDVIEDPSIFDIATEETPTQVSTSDVSQLSIPSSTLTSVSTSPFGCTIPKPKAVKSMDEVFKSVLKYPQERAEKGTKRKKDYVPSVVTSDKWVQYYEQKEKEKIEAIMIKEEKRQKRAEAMKLKENLKSKVVKKQRIKKRMPESDTSDTENSASESVKSASELVESAGDGIGELSLSIGDYVIVYYENNYFPGVIVTQKNSSYQVSAMVKSGPAGWKWPEKDDLLWYPADDIVQIIPPPTVTNSRGVCEVPELMKYKKSK